MTTWVLDPELLIMEVECRPLLYVKSLPEYANKLLKNDAWEEIANKLSVDWESLSKAEKNKRCKEVQTKSKHIRDNFRREYQAQRDITSGQGAKKKYRYYDQLLFLVPYVKDAPTSGNYTAASNVAERAESEGNVNSASNDSEQTEYDVENSENTLSAPPANPQVKKRKKERTISTFEEEVLKSIKNDTAEDEDTSFCLSLVQSLKKIDDDNKMAVKIEILKVIQQYSRANRSQLSQNYQPYLSPSIHEQPQQFSQASQPSSISMNMQHSTIPYHSYHGQPQQVSQFSQPSSMSMNLQHSTVPPKSVPPSKEIKIIEQYQYCPTTSTSIGNSSRPQSAQSYFSQYVPVPSPSPTDTSSSTLVLSPMTNVTASSPEEYY